MNIIYLEAAFQSRSLPRHAFFFFFSERFEWLFHSTHLRQVPLWHLVKSTKFLVISPFHQKTKFSLLRYYFWLIHSHGSFSHYWRFFFFLSQFLVDQWSLISKPISFERQIHLLLVRTPPKKNSIDWKKQIIILIIFIEHHYVKTFRNYSKTQTKFFFSFCF